MIRKETDKPLEMTLNTKGLYTSDILLLGTVREVKVVQSCVLSITTHDLKDVNSNKS